MTPVQHALIAALKANGIDPDFSKWRDTQALGAAVRDALKGEK
jgi:hypothetical protein